MTTLVIFFTFSRMIQSTLLVIFVYPYFPFQSKHLVKNSCFSISRSSSEFFPPIGPRLNFQDLRKMARKISSGNVAYKLRRGQPDLLCAPDCKSSEYLKDTLLSTHRADFKKPPLPQPTARGKRQELLERYLFEKISEEIAKEAFASRAPPSYISTMKDHFEVPGFDPEAGLQPSFQYSLYSDPVLTFWSENRRNTHGVTVPDNPTDNFHRSHKFSKSPAERFDNGEDW